MMEMGFVADYYIIYRFSALEALKRQIKIIINGDMYMSHFNKLVIFSSIFTNFI
jgi:hypothetical protein